MKMRTFINLTKVKSDGSDENRERFEVDTSKPWSVEPTKGGARIHFHTIEGEPKTYTLGDYRWSLGYMPISDKKRSRRRQSTAVKK